MKSPNVKITNWDQAPTQITDVTILNEKLDVTIKNRGLEGKEAYPSTLPVDYSVSITENIKTRHLTSDGVAYGSKVADQRPYKSIDFGKTWTVIPASTYPDDVASQIRKLHNGRILVVTGTRHDAKIYLSDENEDNFVLKYNVLTSVGDVFGMDVFGDLILLAGYGGGTNYDKCFMSRNGGEDWEMILQHPDPTISHFHDIRYDPYENMIWACCGDYGIKNNIFYSNDLGKTWETTYDGVTEGGVRATAIIPMPKCVLFVSDTDHEVFVWRYDRIEDGTQGQQINPYRAWYYRRNVIEPSDFVGSLPAITYGANASAFFGWHCYTQSSEAVQGIVIATRDGYAFTPIWTSPNLMNANYANGVEGGVLGVFGPTVNGELIASFIEGDGTNPITSAVKINFPGWG